MLIRKKMLARKHDGKAVIEELENLGLIEAVSYKRQMFKIAHNGFALADEFNKELSVDCNNSPDAYLRD